MSVLRGGLLGTLAEQLQARRDQHAYRSLRVAESPCGPHQRLRAENGVVVERLAFCSNDYLGLAHHPALIDALAEGARRFGAGSGASHLINGHSRAHADLEDQLAQLMSPWVPEARALFFCTGYMANLALLTGLASAGDRSTTLFCEKLNHASLIDGAKLSGAQVQRYPHADTARLGALLAQSTAGLKIIVTDAVFSMDGCLAPLAELLALAETHDAWLVVDDAHGFGVLGPQGQGSLAELGLRSERLIYMGTLGKAAGVGGAFVAAHPLLIEWLINSARPYIYTTAAPPAVAFALQTSLDLITGPEGDARRTALRARITQLRSHLPAAVAGRGWRLLDSPTAIQPLVVGDNATALALTAALEAHGLWVPAIRPPTVPVGAARLRIALSAAHTEADVAYLVQVLHALHVLTEGAP
ncbi:MAG: 8-amino-7-oxononanoate synthase [Leptothrix ochracea]|uniref:8-amino-7-oxononanoate synthase n=1 Tax=Leptothrix ochracea TaxID=735331 RepID=UPI0034E1C7AA